MLRGGFGLFHPTVAVQGVRDLLATNEFRYGNTVRGSTLAHGFSTGRSSVDPQRLRQRGNRSEPQEPGHLPVQRHPGAGAARGPRPAHELHGLGHAQPARDQVLQRSAREHDEFHNDFDNFPEEFLRLPLYPPYVNTFTNITQNLGSGRFDAAQFELVRRWRNGLAVDVAYTLSHSDSNAPDSGNSSLGVIQFDSFDIEKDRGPDPNVVKHRVVANATWDIPVGHGRKHGADLPGWANELFGGWTVSTIVQARSGPNLTPFFTGFYTTSPWNTGRALDGIGCFCESWRPDQVGDPNRRWFAGAILQPGGVRDAGARAAGEHEKGQPPRAGDLGRQFRLLQGHRDRNTSGSSSRRCSTMRSTTRSSSSAR